MDLMYAIMFYFKLKDLPQFINGRYKYINYIFYRLNLPFNGRQYLYFQFIAILSQFLIYGHLMAYILKVLKGYPPFKQRV